MGRLVVLLLLLTFATATPNVHIPHVTLNKPLATFRALIWLFVKMSVHVSAALLSAGEGFGTDSATVRFFPSVTPPVNN